MGFKKKTMRACVLKRGSMLLGTRSVQPPAADEAYLAVPRITSVERASLVRSREEYKQGGKQTPSYPYLLLSFGSQVKCVKHATDCTQGGHVDTVTTLVTFILCCPEK